MVFGRNPEKYEARALAAERQGKVTKAIKYREKAAHLRAGSAGGMMGAPLATPAVAPIATAMAAPVGTTMLPQQQTLRTPAMYEQRATKWEQRGNYTKAQKNRGKVWRLQNPMLAQQSLATPQFYGTNNQFLGYNAPLQAAPLATTTTATTTTSTINTATAVGSSVVGQQFVQQAPVQLAPIVRERVEYQPIIIREIEIPEVHRVEQHIYESTPFQGDRVITNAPVVDAVVIPRVIEEIQPVIHREVAQAVVERVETHTTEHIVQPTITTKTVETLNKGVLPQTHGLAAGGPAPILVQQNLAQQQQRIF